MRLDWQLTDPIDTITVRWRESDDFTYARRRPDRFCRIPVFANSMGMPDYTVYAKITFPMSAGACVRELAIVPHAGNCDFTGRTSASSKKGAPYRCKVNDKPLVFDESVGREPRLSVAR